MANFYIDTPAFRLNLRNDLMKRIVELKERDYTDHPKYDYAPVDFDDAIDSYDKVLEVAGEICGDIIATNAESVDHEAPTLHNNRVTYAEGTSRNLEAMRKADLMGVTIPRRYNGLNFPITVNVMIADMISRADASFQNVWGLQDCAETLYEFGNESQHSRYLPRVSGGETMSMDLTEPDAGSDLQAVMLKASFDEKENCWRLNGVKRFITNGDSDIHLVLARSEEGTKDGRGLSMFVYDKRDGGVDVRRIENKMGIKGAPTCELVYKNAKAELVGDRRLGLIKYVMALMNGARLGIIAQSTGISEAAYREAYAYALDRKQFGKAIIEFPPVYEMLALIRAKADASRAMLYETARFVDVYKILEDIARERTLTPEERQEMKKYSKLADAYTPMGKGMASEFANQNAYDCIQIHGGSGYMKDYTCERLARDARITNIYEGTTQLQVIAAIRHVTTGTYLSQLRSYEQAEYAEKLNPLKARLVAMTNTYEALVNKVVDTKNTELIDFMARRLVETAAHCVFGYLLLRDASVDEQYETSAEVYIRYGEAEIAKIVSYIDSFKIEELNFYKK